MVDPEMDAWLGRMSQRFPSARTEGLAGDAHDASAREGSSHEELQAEAGTLLRQFRDEYASLQLAGVSVEEVRDVRNRFNSLYGRVTTITDEAELRRVVTDLRAILRDVQDRNRELPGAGLDDDFDIAAYVEDAERPQAASTRGDATAEELTEQLREVDGRSQAVFQRLEGHIPAGERTSFQRRQNALSALLRQNPSAQEIRGSITDAYDLLNDLEMRERELGAGGADQGAEDGAQPEDLRELHTLAQRRIEQLRGLLRDDPTEVDNYVRQLNSLLPRIRRGEGDELERCAVDLRGLVQDLERRLRAEARRRRGGN